MGHAVKSISKVFTGKSGGGKTESKETASSNTSSQSWEMNNPKYIAMAEAGLNDASNFKMPEYQLAGDNTNLTQALAGLSKGTDTQEYKDAAQYLKSAGIDTYNQGNQNLNQATSVLNQYSNLSESDYQKMVASEYDNDLVKSQIADATQDINDQRDLAMLGNNHAAISAGGMGNSRAGVKAGVIAGQALKAVGSASVQYRTAEESAATQRLQNYLNLRTSSAAQSAQIGLSQINTGLNQYGQGMGYTTQANQLQLQNYQNQFTAGQYQKTQEQQRLDVARQNQINAQTPALQRLAYFNQTYLPMANLQTTGNSSGTSNTVANSPGTGGNLLGGLMGMGGSAIGGMYGGAGGATIGGMLGGAFGNAIH